MLEQQLLAESEEVLSTILYMQNIAKLQNSQNPGYLLSVLNQCIVPWCLHAGRAMPSLSCQSSNSGAHLKQKCEIFLETNMQPCSIESTKIHQVTPALCTCLSCHVGDFYPWQKGKGCTIALSCLQHDPEGAAKSLAKHL